MKKRVLETKIVYYGAGLSGKTTNLEEIKKRSNQGRTGEMMSLNTDGDRTLFFDYLPFELGKVNGCDVKVQLYTVPGQAKYSETRKRVLAAADGVVLVLDSQAAALDRNRKTLEDLREHLAANGLPDDLPMVVQLNKRDLPDAMEPKALLEALGLQDAIATESVAFKGQGVFETLRTVVDAVLKHIRGSVRDSKEVISAGTESGLDGETLRQELTAEDGPSSEAEDPKVDRQPVPLAPRIRAKQEAMQSEFRPSPAAPAQSHGSMSTGGSNSGHLNPATSSSGVSLGVSGSASPAAAVAKSSQTNMTAVAAAVMNSSSEQVAIEVQLREAIASSRVLSQRLNQVESSLSEAMNRTAAELEKAQKEQNLRVVEKLESLLGQNASNPGIDALRESIDSLASAVRDVGETQSAMQEETKRQGELLGKLEADVRTLSDKSKVKESLETLAKSMNQLGKNQVEIHAEVRENTKQTKSTGSQVSKIQGVVLKVEKRVEALEERFASAATDVKGFFRKALEEMQEKLIGTIPKQVISWVGVALDSTEEGVTKAVENMAEQIGTRKESTDGVDTDASQRLEHLAQHASRLESAIEERSSQLGHQVNLIAESMQELRERIEAKKSWWRSSSASRTDRNGT
ncbi:MAG: ADP-ribosylation factor-like protein [Myxococcota bacterium]